MPLDSQPTIKVELLRFYYSISGLVSVGFSQKTVISVYFPVSVFHEIWVKQTINCKRNNVIREPSRR